MKQTLTICLAVLASLVAVHLWAPMQGVVEKEETALERVLRTQTLRCAYTVAPTFVDKDPNTGKLSGLGYDITEAMGAALGIKISWGPEVGPHEIFEGFKNNRFDANCTGYWRTPERAHGGDFTNPIFYTPARMFVRKGETRFKTLDDFNRADVTLSTQDGEATEALVRKQLPKAKIFALPGMAPVTDRFVAVVSGKADATPMDVSLGLEFMAQNPGKLELFDSEPLATLPSTIVIAHNQQSLKNFLDAGIAALKEKGELKQILLKNSKYKGSFLPPAVEVGTLE